MNWCKISPLYLLLPVFLIAACSRSDRQLAGPSDIDSSSVSSLSSSISSSSSSSSSTSASSSSSNSSSSSSSSGPSYNRLLNVDYENGELTSGVTGVNLGTDSNTYAANTVNTNSRTGSWSIRYELRDTDTEVFGGTRAESDAIDVLSCRYHSSSNFYYGMSIFIPQGWEDDGAYEDIIFQWKHTSIGPDAFLCIKRTEWYLRINSDLVGAEQLFLSNIVLGAWNDFVFNFEWSTNTNGHINAWFKAAAETNYIQVLDKAGPNMYAGDPGSFSYLKWGLYCPKWNTTNTSGVSVRIIFYDNVRAAYSFADVDPSIP